MNTFHVHDDGVQLPSGDTVTFANLDPTEPIAGIAKLLPSHTWSGYRGNLEIVRHGSSIRVLVACGIILGRWTGHSSAALTFRQATDQEKQPTEQPEENDEG